MPKVYPDRLDTLVQLSEPQDGYFTTEQARNAGLPLHALSTLEQAGHIEREQYGVYRLARWSASRRPGLWRAFLWALRIDPLAAFSHRTALELYEISDINPAKIDVTVLPGSRIRSTRPPAVLTHKRELSEADVLERDGFRVTTLYRTLLDLATDGLARSAVSELLDRSNVPGVSRAQARQIRAVYDLSGETRLHLANAFFHQTEKSAKK